LLLWEIVVSLGKITSRGLARLGDRKRIINSKQNIMKPKKQQFTPKAQSCKGDVMLMGFKKKRDFYLLAWVFHILFFPFFWMGTIAFFHPYLMYGTFTLMVTGITSLFLLVKYDHACNGLP